MKRLLIVAAALLMSSAANAQTSQQGLALPELHKIRTATLSPSYSCRSKEEFQKGYQSTALFLSDYSKKRNSPDLLFNGACRSTDYFQISGGGDDMSLIADLGAEVPLEKITAHSAFNLRNINTPTDYTRFVKSIRVEKEHTYAVLINSREIRGLFIFTVVNYVPN